MAKRRKQARRLPVRVVSRADGMLALEIGSVVQSIIPQAGGVDDIRGYWTAMLPERCPRRVALLGLGGGTVARLLAARCPGVEMVGVERDETVLATARADLGLDDVQGLTVLLADAFNWAMDEAERAPAEYDLICLDLFDAGRLTSGALATPFLRQLARLLSADGTLAVNLMVTGRLQEQLHRLQRVFALDRSVRVRGNLVVHLHAFAAGSPTDDSSPNPW